MKPRKLIPLCEAITHFANERDIRDAKEAYAEIDIPKYQGGELDRATAAAQFPGLISNIFKLLAQPGEYRQRLVRSLCNRIQKGSLVAYGVRTKPELGNDLEEIPDFLFIDPTVELMKNTIESAGHRFELVCIGRRPRDRQVYLRKEEVKKSAKMGRPSKEAEIETIVSEILQDQHSPRNRKFLCDKVREIAEKRGFDINSGYSDSPIKRVITRALANVQKTKSP